MPCVTAGFSSQFLGHSQLLDPLYPVRGKRQFVNWFLVIGLPGRCFTATLSYSGDVGVSGRAEPAHAVAGAGGAA